VTGLREIIDGGGIVMPVACLALADHLSRQGSPSARAEALACLELALGEYQVDPRPLELTALLYAGPDGDAEAYVEASQLRQALDFTPSASLDPAERLLAQEMYEEAAGFARIGIERWPDDLGCREALIKALAGLGDAAAAREHLAELRQRDAARAEELLESLPSLRDP
jgi:hypothetical protein